MDLRWNLFGLKLKVILFSDAATVVDVILILIIAHSLMYSSKPTCIFPLAQCFCFQSEYL